MAEISEFDHEFMTQGSETAECEKLVRLCKLQKWAPHEWYSYQSDKATQGATDCQVADAEINFKTTLEPIIMKALKKYYLSTETMK